MKALGIPLGISFTFWALMGIFRYISEVYTALVNNIRKTETKPPYTAEDIAVILPAHNEEKVIRSSIQYLKKSLDAKQIYVVSDGSSDKTYRRARLEGCHVSRLNPGQGKAKAMVYLIERFELYKNYKLIFIVDADTRIDPVFVPIALKLFVDPEIGVVFGSARIKWPQHIVPQWKYYIIAYRERLNRTLQYFLNYGMTWKHTNVNFVIPGFATIYKSEVLKNLEIDTPGLLIEDFNLAFQLNKTKIAKMGHRPAMTAWDQHPDNLKDYWNQVRRWNIGFFQTMRKNGVWPSFFWLTISVFSIEVILNCMFTLFLPALFLYFIFWHLVGGAASGVQDSLSGFSFGPFTYMTLGKILIFVFLIDYIFTVIIGVINKKPQFMFYGLFFFFMHYVTSLILISSLVPGFFGKSNGRWTSPKRRAE